MNRFIHLHCHSSIGSMLDAMTNIDEMFKRAKELGQPGMAITDHGCMAGIFDARKASKKYGIKFIPGIEAYFVDDVTDKEQKRRHIVLLAKNEKGYRNLLSLNYEGYLNFQYVAVINKVFPKIDWNLLEKYHEGIICLTACGSGLLSRQMFVHNEDGEWLLDTCHTNLYSAAKKLKNIFGDDLYLEVQPHNLKIIDRNRRTGEIKLSKTGEEIVIIDQDHINRKLIELGKSLNINLVATADIHYLNKENAKDHDMLMAISSKAPLSDKTRHRYEVEEFYMKDRQTIFNHFKDKFGETFANEVCDNTIKIFEKCIESDYLDVKEPRFPKFDVDNVPDLELFKDWQAKQTNNSIPSDHSYMRFKCVSEFKKLYGHLKGKEKEKYIKRMMDEIKVLEMHNFCSYMLIVSDFIEYAKSKNIMVGPGRGCLIGETKVLTDKGIKELKNIVSGDFVYSHTGQLKEVLNTFKYEIKEELLKIQTNWSYEDIILTKDHKLYAEKSLTTSKFKDRLNSGLRTDKCKRWVNFQNNPQWLSAQDLSIQDGIFMPFLKRNIEKQISLDLVEFIDEDMFYDKDYIYKEIPLDNIYSYRNISKKLNISRSTIIKAKRGNKINQSNSDKIINYLNSIGTNLSDWQNNKNIYTKKHNRFICFDNDFAYILGRWIGDGWKKENKDSNYIGIAFNSDDTIGVEKIKSYFNGIGFECKLNVSKTKKLIQLYVYGKVLPRIFSKFISDYKNSSGSKHLPVAFRNMETGLLKSMLNGLIDSDGSLDTNGNRTNIDTTSERLACEVKEALLYLKIPSSIFVRDEFLRGKYLCRKSYKIRFNEKNKNNIFDNGYFVNIKNIEVINNIKYVYDIQVKDDTSYLTLNYAVHNSVGGSLVGNLLGIHTVDPIQYGLLFERFHNKEKKAFPDIDTDFSSDGRDAVEKYIVEKYGKNKVAHVSNLSRMTPKVIIKDIARSLELGGGKSEAFKIANKITDTIPSDVQTIDDALKVSKEFVEFCQKYPELEKYGRRLVGLERAYATHAAGIVISDIDLSTYVPLRLDKDGVVSVQYEKNRCEEMGLIKMDLLGLEHLRIIEHTIINSRLLGMKCPDPKDIDLNDKKVWDEIAKGRTMCVFQMGSTHMKALCKQIRPQNIEDLSLVNALGRPSAGQKSKDGTPAPRDTYILRRDGKEPVSYKYECLRPVLSETLGICVYEEQLAKLANAVAGWDLNKADGLRKLTKLKEKGREFTTKLKEDFIVDGMKHNNLKREEVDEIWEKIIEPFSGYGFNKAHGIFYSINGYHTAYYKYYFPAAFMAAVLQSEAEKNAAVRDSNIRAYKKEAERLGLTILQPDLNKSGQSFSVVDKNIIITGLNAIKGIGNSAVNNILESKLKGSFKSFADFLYRTNSRVVRKDTIQALAMSGCFDSLKINRKAAFIYYQDIRVKANKYGTEKSKEGIDELNRLDGFIFDLDKLAEEWTLKEKLDGEKETLGEYISGNINDVYNGFFTGKGVTPLTKIKNMSAGTLIRTESIVSDIKEMKLKSGKNKGKVYVKCDLTDLNNDIIQLTVWPEQWSYYKNILDIGSPIRAVCKINSYNGANSLVLERIENGVNDAM